MNTIAVKGYQVSSGRMSLEGVTGYLLDLDNAVTLIYKSGRMLPIGIQNKKTLDTIKKNFE